jgi:hypothetical protein
MRPHIRAALLATGLLAACGGDDGTGSISSAVAGDPLFMRSRELDVEDRSAENENRSHFAGGNCLRCHQSHGPGPGRYGLGATIYEQDDDVLPNPVIELWRADDGADAGIKLEEKVAELQGDALGNVFTTQTFDFRGERIIAIVRSQRGDQTASMPVPIESGACNLCHRGSARIRVYPLVSAP